VERSGGQHCTAKEEERDSEPKGGDSQTQRSFLFLLVTRRILPAARAMGMAQQTTRGVERPLVLMMGVDGKEQVSGRG